jgi:hypothetical protein
VSYLEELEGVIRDALPRATKKLDRSAAEPPAGFQPA